MSSSIELRKILIFRNYHSTCQADNLQCCFKNFLIRILLFITLQYKYFVLFLGYCCTFYELYIVVCFLCLRLQQRSIERAMDLANSFTWDDLPTRDAKTGRLTAAGWIPLIKTYSIRAAILILTFHSVQSTTRIVTSHEPIVIAWYPFDWTVSPYYELVIISQVRIYVD